MMTDFDPHPVCSAFPAMPPAAYRTRLEDYRAHPERAADTAVLLARDEADGAWKIADGRHHYRICKELRYECRFQEFTGTPAELVALVEARNVNRRHQTESQIAAALAALHAWERGGDRRSAGFKAAPGGFGAQEAKARESGISADTLQRAVKVARRAPELLPAVRDGKLDAKTAAQVADLPPEERAAIVSARNPKKLARAKVAKNKPTPAPAPVSRDQIDQALDALTEAVTKITLLIHGPFGEQFIKNLGACGLARWVHFRDKTVNGKTYRSRFVALQSLRHIVKRSRRPVSPEQLRQELEELTGLEDGE